MRTIQSAVGGLLLIAACAGPSLENLRDLTYPPDFHYITKQDVQTAMGALASEVDALDQALRRGEGAPPNQREDVVAILSRMQSLAHQLKRRAHTNHPRIRLHADRLQHDIDRALSSARKEPPNYYFAGVVAGACTYCHAPRHGAPD
ncbi:MAG: hypothetical protein MJE66_03050 [Proteobacteria bacterium]|nr:hypothetical protein [Pseudomonadota bacterium]